MYKTFFQKPRSVQIVVALYAGVVLVLILLAVSNYPVQWRQQVNNERHRYVEVIAQALQYYVADHSGALPDIPAGTTMIANTDACAGFCPALGKELSCYNLTAVLVPGYMKEMLRDPLVTSKEQTSFYIRRENAQIQIGACDTFFGQKVEVSYNGGSQ